MKKNWNYEFKTMYEAFDEVVVKKNVLLEIHNMIKVNEMYGDELYSNFCIKNGAKEFMEWCERDIFWAKEIEQLLTSNGFCPVGIVDNKQQPINVLETIENKKPKSPKI